MVNPQRGLNPRRYGTDGISEPLRAFTGELPYERGPILDFVMDIAAATPPGASVLDLGAGNAPYRELFAHTVYRTNEWTESEHIGAAQADIIGPADALPVPGASFDLVICTQVLEHVAEPLTVLSECFRVLAPGGRLGLTVPLLWEPHEVPHDYFRFTEHGLAHLLSKAGFVELDIRPRSDGFSAIAQLMYNLGWAIGPAGDGLDEQRLEARRLLGELSDAISKLAPLDPQMVMPLGYTAGARKP